MPIAMPPQWLECMASFRFSKLPLMAVLGHVRKGQNISALPLSSDIYLLGNIQSIVHFNAKVFDSAFNLGVA